MSTEIANSNGIKLTRFWGGIERGLMLSIGTGYPNQINLDTSQIRTLKDQLTKYLEGNSLLTLTNNQGVN